MNLLFFTHASPQFLPPVILDKQETVCGPNYSNLRQNNRYKYVNTPLGSFDYQIIKNKLGVKQQPDLILVHADATFACLPENLPANATKVLMVGGATHILTKPIYTLIQYAARIGFDAIVVWNRHNAHFFTEYGFPNVFWMPGLTFGIPEIPIPKTRNNQLCFFGQLGEYHPRRTRIIQQLKQAGISITGGKLPRRESLELVASSTLSLNISLNGEFNLRVFESSQNGSLLISDKLSEKTGFEIFYPDGDACITYSNTQELIEKINYFTSNTELTATLASKAQSITKEYFTSEARHKAFFALLNNEVTLDVFRLEGEARCQIPVCRKEDRTGFFNRVLLYEMIQEWHRIQENVEVSCSKGVNPLIMSDMSDLIRVSQFLAIELEAFSSEWEPALKELGVNNLKAINPASISQKRTDLLITTISDLEEVYIQEAIQNKTHKCVFISDLYVTKELRIIHAMVEFGYSFQNTDLYGLFSSQDSN